MARRRNLKKKVRNFDFETWFRNRNIAIIYKGANVGHGWVGMNCPFCPDGDTGFHLGVNKKSKMFSCWRCKTKGNIIQLIKKLVPDANINQIFDAHSFKNRQETPENETKFASICKFPENSTDKIYKLHGEYLKQRNFNPKELYFEYKLKSTGIDAHFGYRIIIPIYKNDVLMTYTARDVSGKAKIRYKACPLEKSVKDPKSLIYNIDTADDILILVEGATDVWRIGRGCGAVMGAAMTNTQVKEIVHRNLHKVVILFDNDTPGRVEGEKLGNTLSLYTDVEIYSLPENINDPGELEKNDVYELRKKIFGRKY